MRVGVYAGRHEQGRGGMATYGRSLVSYFLRHMHSAPLEDIELTLYCDEEFIVPEFAEELSVAPVLVRQVSSLSLASAKKVFRANAPELRVRVLVRILPKIAGRRGGYLLDQILLPVLAKRDGIDVMHSVANLGLLLPTVRQVVTVHDLFQGWPADDSDSLSQDHGTSDNPTESRQKSLVRSFYRKAFLRQFKVAEYIITDCNAVREEVCRKFSFDPSYISSIPLGLDFEFSRYLIQHDEREKLYRALEGWRERRSIPKFPVLFFASSDPRKNLSRVLPVIKAVLENENAAVGICLDSAAKHKSAHSLFEKGVFRYRSADKDSCILLDPLPREELPLLFACSRAVFVPTLAEGFGLPVIEGLAAGAPVIGGQLEHIDELVPDKNQFYRCDVRYEASMLNVLQDVLNITADDGALSDEELARRRKAFAREFPTMDQAAAKVLKVYRSIAPSPRRMSQGR